MLNIRCWNLHRPQVWCLFFVVTSPLPSPTWPLQHREWQPPSHKRRYKLVYVHVYQVTTAIGLWHTSRYAVHVYIYEYHEEIYFSVVSRANWSSSVSRTECCGPSTQQCSATGQPWRYWGERVYQERYGHPSEKGMYMKETISGGARQAIAIPGQRCFELISSHQQGIRTACLVHHRLYTRAHQNTIGSVVSEIHPPHHYLQEIARRQGNVQHNRKTKQRTCNSPRAVIFQRKTGCLG